MNSPWFTGNAWFNGATFTSDASFAGAAFSGYAWFSGTTFIGYASFSGTTFTSDAWFTDATFTSDAWFGDATFTSDAGFTDATFTGNAVFIRTVFTSDASFDSATFTGNASFEGTTFTGNASFDSATFTGNASFNDATFTGTAVFIGVTFAGIASFKDVTFNSTAIFRRAAFHETASFEGAIARAYDYTRAQFHVTDPGPWIARQVTLADVIFHVRTRLTLVAVAMDCRRMEAREGVHLVGRGGTVDFEDAEFLRRSILAHSASKPSVPERDSPGERPERFDELTPTEQARWTAKDEAFQLAQQLADELGPQQTTRTRVVSLRRATAGDLVLSGVGLDNCAFAGAHGLDRLRIDATCSFQRPPAWLSRTWRPFTSRRLIFEEAQWRQAHTPGWAPAPITATARAELDDPVPTALEIAGIYRDLRKGLEDTKDEPGAADFYYGEMEMRRLATRGHRHQRSDKGDGARGRRPSWTERRLLDAYWAVSGYGLRAWRALTALTILLVGCAALFTLPTFAYLPASPQQAASVNLRTGAIQYAPITQPGKTGTTAAVPFGKSLKFTSTESLTLIRASGTPFLETTEAGKVLDIALRLLAPLLLGLALLAVRGRIKR